VHGSGDLVWQLVQTLTMTLGKALSLFRLWLFISSVKICALGVLPTTTDTV
jgi:hypothetical protein